jgi:hypothetical protein
MAAANRRAAWLPALRSHADDRRLMMLSKESDRPFGQEAHVLLPACAAHLQVAAVRTKTSSRVSAEKTPAP